MNQNSTSESTAQRREHRVSTADGLGLVATVFEPNTQPTQTVIIAGGVAVPQFVYQLLAEWLCERGLRCVTFDYRGSGDSMESEANVSTASLTAWATLDTRAIFEFCEQAWSEPVSLIAHSFGGQTIGLVDALQRLDSVVLIACQCGTARHWDGLERLLIWSYWHAVLPTLSGLFRMSPKVLGMRLPRGVAREWAHWGRQRDWYFSFIDAAERRYSGLASPVLAYTINDDDMARPRAVEALVKRFDPARVDHRSIDPEQFAVRQIGHFGVFRDPRLEPVWQQIHAFISDK